MDIEKQKAVLMNRYLQAVTNEISTRSELWKKVLDPRRDLDEECGYVTNPGADDFNDMYEKEGIARRVVHVVPEESWQVDPIIYENDEDNQTEFEKRWEELAEEFDFYSVMARADALSGIGAFGIILLGFDDGKDLSEPVEPGKQRELLYLRVFDETVVDVTGTETDVTNSRYGLPVSYSIKVDSATKTTIKSQTLNVHWTRVVHLADNRRMSEVRGTSRLKPVFNRLQDLRKLMGGSAEMFWQGAFPGLSFEADPKLLADGAGEIDNEGLKEEMQRYANGLQRWLSTAGIKVNSLAPQVADPSPHVETQLKVIALTIGVPYRVFVGTEQGQLASGQDARAWAKRLEGRQNNYITPHIVRPFIDRLIDANVVPEPKAVSIDWPSMVSLSPEEEAGTAKTKSEAMKAYTTGAVDVMIPPYYYLTEVLKMDAEIAKTIIDASLKNIEPREEQEPDDDIE